jgi:hypothetical protein
MNEKSFTQRYIDSARDTYKRLPEEHPVLWKMVTGKRYILPNFRQADYVSQEACDWLLIDSFFGYLNGVLSMDDHVSCHCTNNMIVALHYNRPTFFLERELGEPLLRTTLPLDYYASDINWRWPAFRIYLPKGLLTLKRGKDIASAMFLDIAYMPKGPGKSIPEAINNELNSLPRIFLGKLPYIISMFEGFSVTTFLDFESITSAVGYSASAMLEQNKLREVIEQIHKDKLASPFKTDEADDVFINKMLGLAINILLFLSSVPMEYEKEEALRKAKLEGKKLIPGLFPAKFVGKAQLRPTAGKSSHIADITGKHTASHWAAGHWKRQPFGPGRTERKLIWIVSYPTGEYRK